ncbi:p55 [Little cherry virus 2]|uniref:p55 n=1 Tax=Little cherry virus 2 TaxID=154339 RepID=Q7T735_9CLOS|nr:p55 [Little cherry virus 2]AAP87786.1 p55 [Little cherry virus 2]
MTSAPMTDYDKLDKTYRLYDVWRTTENFYDSFELTIPYPFHKMTKGHILLQVWYGGKQLNLECLVRKNSNKENLELMVGSWFAGNFSYLTPTANIEWKPLRPGGSSEVTIGLYNHHASQFFLTVNGTEVVRTIKAIPYQPVVFGFEVQIELPNDLSNPLVKCPYLRGLPNPIKVEKRRGEPFAFTKYTSALARNTSSNKSTGDIFEVGLDELGDAFEKLIRPALPKPVIADKSDSTSRDEREKTNGRGPESQKTSANEYEKPLPSAVSSKMNETFGLQNTSFYDLLEGVDDLPTVSTIGVPGLLTTPDLLKVANNLVNFFKEKHGESDKLIINKCMVCFLQMAILHTTGDAATVREVTSLTYSDGFVPKFNYAEVCTVIKKSLDNTLYPNPVRTFLRHCSDLCIDLMIRGYIKPNVKLIAKYGIPEKFYPYCFDFSMVNTVTHGVDAVFANLLAKLVALKSSSHKRQTTHNALELIDKANALNLV